MRPAAQSERYRTPLTSGLEMMLEKCSEVRAPPCSRTSPPCSEFWPLSTSNLFPEESVMRERIWVEWREEEESGKSDEGNCSVKTLFSGVLSWFLGHFWDKVSTLGHVNTQDVIFDWIWMLFESCSQIYPRRPQHGGKAFSVHMFTWTLASRKWALCPFGSRWE